MNTKIIKKIILILVVATFLTIGLTGCGGGIIIISTTGTVVVQVDHGGTYAIYMNTVLQGTTDAYGRLTITKVPGGTYYFVANGYNYSPYYYYYYYGFRTKTTYNGTTNYVTIPVNLYHY
jgi:hypothetical protein